jgi:hypothetical protein
LLTDSTAARFVAQAISWLLNSETKCFPQSEVEQALSYLGFLAPVADVSGSLAGLHAAIEFKQRRTG